MCDRKRESDDDNGGGEDDDDNFLRIHHHQNNGSQNNDAINATMLSRELKFGYFFLVPCRRRGLVLSDVRM